MGDIKLRPKAVADGRLSDSKRVIGRPSSYGDARASAFMYPDASEFNAFGAKKWKS